MKLTLALLTLWLAVVAPPAPQTSPPSGAALDSARHALSRLAYGPVPGQTEEIARQGVMRWIDRQLEVDEVNDPALRGPLARFDILSVSSQDLVRRFTEAQRERRQAPARGDTGMRAGNRAASDEAMGLRRLLGQLPSVLMVRSIGSERQFGEVMADFWFNHFNVFIGKNLTRVYLPEYVERTIRPHALGRFEDLLVATATSPAMMIYLDNAQSVAPGSEPPRAGRMAAGQRPGRFPGIRGANPGMDSMMRQAQARRPTGLNENYARELLELHTVGVNGGYTQKDVTEVARILTGWSIVPPVVAAGGMRRFGGASSGFQFHDWAHDRGEKTVLGVSFAAGQGQEEGFRLLAMLASHPSTMHFVSGKLCARLVNDDPPDGCIDDAVRAWKRSQGNIREVLRAILHGPDFWAPVNRGAKVKTPLEFVASAVRAVGGVPDTTPRLGLAVGRLGQPLYQQSAPTGYGERQDDWVNSGALLARMNFAMGLAANRLPGVTVDLDKVLPVTPDRADLVAQVDRVVLAGRMSETTRQVILEQIADLDPAMARAVAVGLAIGGPEFQRQ